MNKQNAYHIAIPFWLGICLSMLSLILHILPWGTQAIVLSLPQFSILTLALLTLLNPEKYGTWYAVILGLILDILTGVYLGFNALMFILFTLAFKPLFIRSNQLPLIREIIYMMILLTASKILYWLLAVMLDLSSPQTHLLISSLISIIFSVTIWITIRSLSASFQNSE